MGVLLLSVVLSVVVALTIRGHPYSLEMRSGRSQTCLLVDLKGQSWAFAPKRVNPWQLRAGDVDGNGKMDFLVGVNKPTNLIKTPHRTIFIYEFTGEEVVPKWKASTLGQDLVDFNFVQLEGPRVIVVENDLHGGQSLSEWKWVGFGLRRLETLAWGKKVVLAGLPWPEKTVIATVDGNTLKWKR